MPSSGSVRVPRRSSGRSRPNWYRYPTALADPHDRAPAGGAGRRDTVALLRRTLYTFRPPVRQVRFWVVQVGVLSIALVHDILLVDLTDGTHPFSAADAMTSALLLVPVIYAALNFGVRGAIGTAVWATALIAPHWLLMHPLTPDHLSVELGNILILNTVAIVVGQRVESERRARYRAESALHVAEIASTRYQTLFDEQPAPVIITDWHGTISEMNTAAVRLVGRVAPGSSVCDVLATTVAQLLSAKPPRLTVRTAGEVRLFTPTAHTIRVNGDTRLVQIVLTDVTEQQRRQQEQHQFSGRLLAVQEEERRRLAQELHDDPLQNLVYLTRTLDDLREEDELPASMARTVRYGAELAAEAAIALRKAIHGLRPPVLDDIGVGSALRQLVADVRRRTTLSVSLRCTGVEQGLPAELKLTAYRVVQESLNNVVRHADARRVSVRVRFGDVLALTITDDGRGLPPGPAPGGDGAPVPSGAGLGLIGMRERVSLAGGSLRVERRSPHGTTVRVTLPSEPPADRTAAPAADQPPAG